MEHLLRSCVHGLRVAELTGLKESERAGRSPGWECHADAHEQAAWFGDDIALEMPDSTRSAPDTGELVG